MAGYYFSSPYEVDEEVNVFDEDDDDANGLPCEACGAEQGEPCRPGCIGEALELERIRMQVNEDRRAAFLGDDGDPAGDRS